MIFILTPDKIKEDKKMRVVEQSKRTEQAATEETRVMKKLNQAREVYDTEIKKLDAEIETKKREYKDIIEPLKREVVDLESKRAEALKPIHLIEEEANNKLKLADEKSANVALHEEKIASEREEIMAKMEALNDLKDELDMREDKIIKQEEKVIEAERHNKISALDLADRWVAYHQAIEIHNKSVEDKHARIQDRESRCQAQERILTEKEADLANREELLRTQYEDLAKAKKIVGQ